MSFERTDGHYSAIGSVGASSLNLQIGEVKHEVKIFSHLQRYDAVALVIEVELSATGLASKLEGIWKSLIPLDGRLPPIFDKGAHLMSLALVLAVRKVGAELLQT